MKIAIVGPGAMGLLFAGYLSRTSADLTLVDIDEAHAALINQNGIRWEGMEADTTVEIPVTVGLKNPGNTDLLILCVKAYDTDTASRELARSGYRGPVLTLQNGAGNIEILARNLPGSSIIAGATSEGANLVGPAHVRHAGRGRTEFGAVHEGKPGLKLLEAIVKLMGDAGLDAGLTDDPQSLVWGKVLVNSGINPLTAILRVQNGRLMEIEPARKLMKELVLEGWGVLRRMDIRPAYADPVARVEEVCGLTAANYSSMYQDILRGRTEIDFINGAIVREGERLGMRCPINETVTQMVRSMERLALKNPLDSPGR
jgi:2-dehydropantoate 2-reductase